VTLLARPDRLPLTRPHHRLLAIGGLGHTFDAMDPAVAT
jgi:putative MFS transporter